MKQNFRFIQFIALIALLVMTSLPAAYASGKEQLVKAAFIYNFTKFVSWPGSLDIAAQDKIHVCILGNNTLGDASSVIEKGSSNSLAIKTKIISSPPTEEGKCHILYVTSASHIDNAVRLSAQNKSLTVSDLDGFVNAGGMIGFVKESNKVRLYINKTASDSAGLKINAQLLEIARKVIR